MHIRSPSSESSATLVGVGVADTRSMPEIRPIRTLQYSGVSLVTVGIGTTTGVCAYAGKPIEKAANTVIAHAHRIMGARLPRNACPTGVARMKAPLCIGLFGLREFKHGSKTRLRILQSQH